MATRKQQTAELLRLISAGPELVTEGNSATTKQVQRAAELDVHRWLAEGIVPLLVELVPELRAQISWAKVGGKNAAKK